MTNGAFSLLELMIVIALVTLLTSLGSLTSSFFNPWLARLQLNQVYMACQCMRAQAMALHRTLHVQCDTHKHTYRIGDHSYQLTGALFDYLPGSNGPPGNPTKPITHAITFTKQCISFYPDGTTNAGTIYMTDPHHTRMYALTIAVGEIPAIRTYIYSRGWQRLP